MSHLLQDTGRKSVFIIDDEVDLCLLLKSYFLRKNYQVFIAHTVEDALPRIKVEKPNYVILDCSTCKDIEKTRAEIEEAAPGVQVLVTGYGRGIKLSDYF